MDDDAEVRGRWSGTCEPLAEHYRIGAPNSGGTALATLAVAEKRNEPVALFLVDQRMPEMSGVEFIAKGIDVP